MCDDIHKTVDELKTKGVEFPKGIEDQGFGLVTSFSLSQVGRDCAVPAAPPTAMQLNQA